MMKSWQKVAARWRHSRGFGIHSPFAYDLIVNTLRERQCGYYLYDYIEANHKSNSKMLKLIVRLLSRLCPASISVVGSLEDVMLLIAVKVNRNVVSGEAGHTEMLIVTPGASGDKLPVHVAATLQAGGDVIITDLTQYPGLAALVVDKAMTFSNGKMLIAAGRRDLPRQHHDIYF